MFTDPVKVYLDSNKSESEPTSQAKLHGQAGLAFAKGVNHLAVGTFKGGMVDVPLALAEGFRNVPRLWGENVKEQEKITGWKSGATVAGKVSLVHDEICFMIRECLNVGSLTVENATVLRSRFL